MIPVKLTIVGDVARGKEFIKFARQQMDILKRYRALGLKDSRRERSPLPGITVECITGRTPEEIRIYVAGPGAGSEGLLEKKKIYRCICNCAFSVGQVLEITGTLEDANLYTIMACNRKEVYVLYENTLASDFTEYRVGDKVILIPYNRNNYLCCTGGQDASGCHPRKSELQFEDEGWRATYRIIPWCASNMPKWLETTI